MLTVGSDPAGVEVRLSSAALRCPDCGDRLARWGHDRVQSVRREGPVRWRPRRARCSGCGSTRILLPASCLPRRADTVEVIGAALVAASAGWGIVALRGWSSGRPRRCAVGCAGFAARAGPPREGFTALAVVLQPAPVMPEPTGSEVGDAVAAIMTAARAVRSRWPELPLSVSAWQMTAAITSGALLAPTLRLESINTSRLW